MSDVSLPQSHCVYWTATQILLAARIVQLERFLRGKMTGRKREQSSIIHLFTAQRILMHPNRAQVPEVRKKAHNWKGARYGPAIAAMMGADASCNQSTSKAHTRKNGNLARTGKSMRRLRQERAESNTILTCFGRETFTVDGGDAPHLLRHGFVVLAIIAEPFQRLLSSLTLWRRGDSLLSPLFPLPPHAGY